MKLTADIVEAFAGAFLSPRYDTPQPTPDFHRECWELYTSDAQSAMVIAPRGHAKTTALSFDYLLAEVLFRNSMYVILVGSTEENAAEILSNISDELHENEPLLAEFGPFVFETDTKTDIIVRFQDGHRFRILARGAEQKIRGKMWAGQRPDLLLGDDLEDDEQTESRDRRIKFRRWFFRAAKQSLSQKGKVRIHGTILNEDSLLSRLRRNSTWKHLFYKAHNGFDDFSDILWPEQWTEEKLRSKRQEFIDDGDAGGYSQEYLNEPLDSSEAYLRKADFLPMEEEDHSSPKIICVGADFAISKADKANRTSFTIGGKSITNVVHFIDQRVGRWDSLEIVEEMFLIQRRWNPEVFWVEDGVIWKGISPMIYREMQTRGIWINLQPRLPIKDKATRGRSLQRRMRGGGCRFDKQAEWYPGFENELLKFTGHSDATLDDQFDSAALLSLGFDDMAQVDEEDFISDEESDMIRSDPRITSGRNKVTGY